ncbi:Cytoplasmic tRNA 2-thiolation protein 2 [Rhodotorula toruloides]|nr:Cytoplasmic tRNA 2-thiolation protein 2 [Rhodotorula toruloides]
MSCSQPQDDGAAAPEQPVHTPQHCARCALPPTVVARGTAYCDDHFTQSLASRFRRGTDGARLYAEKGRETYEGSAGPSDVAARRDARRSEANGSERMTRLVVAFSGGCSSRALLDLVKTTYFSHLLSTPATSDLVSAPNGKGKGKKHGLPRRPVFAELEVVFVDESSVPGEPDSTVNVRRVAQEATPFARFTALKLEDAFASAHSSALPLSVSTLAPSLPIVPPSASSSASSADNSDSRRTHLVSLLSNPSLSPTSLASLRAALRSSLILSHVRQTSSSPAVLLLGDSGTRSAITTLSGMSLGRGFSIGEESGAEYLAASLGDASGANGQTSGAGEVLVVRPLVHATLGELEHYCRLMELEALSAQQRGVVDESAKKKTIQGLVEDFILSLETSFPSTVSTVTRTSHKLGLRSSHASFVAAQARSRPSAPLETACLCPVCGLPAPERAQAESWRETIAISDLQAVLRAEGEGVDATLRTTGEDGIEARRKPYEPSKAHLLDSAGAAGEAVANGDISTPSTPPPTAADDDAGPSLAPYLCYGCLIALSSSSSSAAAKKSFSASSTLVLPPYVQDALRIRVERDQGVVGKKELRREEDLRKEVEEFLLDDEEDGAEELTP